MNAVPRVFVGLSGGVDSSVAALRLKKRGYEVVGVFIKVWHPDWLVCNWEEERLDAMRVAAHLNIPFLTCDAEKEYKDDVAQYFINEYKIGRTPNPDVMCNQHVKFGAFMRFAKEYQADYIATGHYARRFDNSCGPELHRGIDPSKDQSYFLWTLTKEQLSFSLFPVGDTIKDHIRAEATNAGIPTAQKKDSQGVCFLGHIDIYEFLSHYISLNEGPVLDNQGQVIGTHKGAFIYTAGQRHGLNITSKNGAREPYYVVGKDVITNTVTASTSKPYLAPLSDIKLTDVLLRSEVAVSDSLLAQTRYRQEPFTVQLMSRSDNNLELSLVTPTDTAAAGQSCVLYQGTKCLGGGIIS